MEHVTINDVGTWLVVIIISWWLFQGAYIGRFACGEMRKQRLEDRFKEIAEKAKEILIAKHMISLWNDYVDHVEDSIDEWEKFHGTSPYTTRTIRGLKKELREWLHYLAINDESDIAFMQFTTEHLLDEYLARFKWKRAVRITPYTFSSWLSTTRT